MIVQEKQTERKNDTSTVATVDAPTDYAALVAQAVAPCAAPHEPEEVCFETLQELVNDLRVLFVALDGAVPLENEEIIRSVYGMHSRALSARDLVVAMRRARHGRAVSQ